ncbi:MAG TPA: C25 family cysteine peptidase, partial [Fibrobacteria bacterium]|nr:C25 family cysteine peptidase [Fibrobacteria bacterium]
MRSFPLVLTATAFCFGSSFQTLVDRSGQWEAVWRGDAWRAVPVGSGSWSAQNPGLPQSEHPGDLDAPRLRALLALPANSSWRLEILGDSGQILSKRNWARIPRIDPRTGKASPAPATELPTSTEKVTGSVRMVSLDLPLTALESDGTLRVRTLLHVRVSWTGSVRPVDGTPWKNIVDNPGGILPRIAGASGRRMGAGVANLGGQMLAIQVGDTAPFSTREDGVVRLTGAQIYQVTGASPGSVSWSNVALYGGTGDTVSTSNPGAPPAPGLRLLPLHRVDRNGDGVLDPNDEVWFWARGTSIWKADSTVPGGWTFSIHPYGETRRYFLRLDAPQGSPELGAPRVPSSPRSFSTVTQPVWAGSPNQLLDIESQESTTDPSTGTGWFWWNGATYSTLGPTQLAYPSTTTLPGLSTDSGLVTVYTAGHCSLSSGNIGGMGFQVAGKTWVSVARGAYTSTFSVHGLSATGNRYSLSNATGLQVSGYTVDYQRDVSKLDSAAFPTPSMGAVSVPVGDSGTCWVLEHGSAERTCSVRGGVLRDSSTDPDTWYAVFGSNPGSVQVTISLEAPPSQPHAIQDPTASGGFDMVVVAPDAFLDLAEEYAAWRGNSVQIRPMKVGILRAQDVWDLWGSGAMDPAVLRNALRWASSQWGTSHALLMGGGHADPRHVEGPSDPVYLPQWEDDEIATDDFYTWFDTTGSPLPSLALGRVPARSVAEARAWLDKVELFEDPSKKAFGTWRNTVLLAADDEFHPDTVAFVSPDPGQDFSGNTEALSESMVNARPWLQTEKLFEQTYPLDAANSKPEAKLALVNLLNQGAMGFNFFGHGAPYQMTDEDLMDIPTFQSSVINPTSPFVFYAGSCSVGRDDLISSRGLSEIFTISSGKGCVAAVGGMRSTQSSGNTALAVTFWKALLDTSTATPRTTGEALLRAKNFNGEGDDANQQLYNLLGDPATIPFPGLLKVNMDSVPDSLSALTSISLSGNAPGAGTVSLRLDHPLPADTFTGTDVEVVFPTPQQLLSLSTTTSAGKYATSILLPAKIPFGDSAQFKAYAWDPTTRRDGGAVAAPRLMAGVGKDIPTVTTGPALSIRPCDSSWTGGVAFGKLAQIPLPFCLEVDLRDSFGISTDQGPDEGVVFTLVGVKDPWHPDLHQGTDYHSAYAQLDLDSTLMLPGNTY